MRPPEGSRRRWALLTTSSSTGANPRHTTVVTLTPVATTATKNSIWNIAVSTPTVTTRRHWCRASDQQLRSRPVARETTTSTPTATTAR